MRPGGCPKPRLRRLCRVVAAHDHDVFERRARAEFVRQQVESFGGRDQRSDVAVLEDVGDLLRPQQRVHRHEDPARCGDSEDGVDRLDALVEEHRYSIVAPEAKLDQAARDHRRVSPEIGVGTCRVPVGECGVVAVGLRTLLEQVVQACLHRSLVILERTPVHQATQASSL